MNMNTNGMIKHFGQLNRARADRQLLKVLATRSDQKQNRSEQNRLLIYADQLVSNMKQADDRIKDL